MAVLHLHFIGVAGRAMGAMAIALARAGHTISGSDRSAYDPMRRELAQAGIAVLPWSAANIHPRLDAVIAGRRMSPDHPECLEAQRCGVPRLSFPSFLRQHFLTSATNLVVAGGVGKTTTTSLLAWILDHAGLAPDFLIGGLPRNFPFGARLAGSPLVVLEGDEYASGPDDPSPKFLHYQPEILIVTNLLSDHPDLYPDAASLFAVFAELVRRLPASGLLIVPAADSATASLAACAGCQVATLGDAPDATVPMTRVRLTPLGTAFTLGGVEVQLPMMGLMNARNAAMAMTAALHVGVPATTAAAAIASFRGLADRQQSVVAGRSVMVRDKASHPESIALLAAALRQQFPGRTLTVVHQPRATGGRHWIYQRDLPAALALFDRVILSPPYEHNPPPHVAWAQSPFSLDLLCQQMAGQVPVTVVADVFELPGAVADLAAPDEVVLVLLREQFAAVVDDIEAGLSARRGEPATAGRDARGRDAVGADL